MRTTPFTSVELAAIAAARREWLAVGLCTDPADRPRAEAAVTRLYGWLGRPAPQIIWMDGPATSALVVATARASLGASLRDSLGASLRDSLRASLRDSLGDSLGASLGDSLRESLRDSLGASLGASLRDSLRASLRDSLGDSLGASQQFYGAHEAGWIAYYSHARNALGVRYDQARSDQLDAWGDLARSCGWWSAWDGTVIIAERPSIQRLDERGVGHCADGPAIRCRDRWEVHMWHGTVVPKQWIEAADSVDPSLALIHPQIEQRRALAEILGWERVLAQLTHRTIDTDADPQIGTLIEVDLPDSPHERFLRVTCGTGRRFCLPVPPEMQSARQANAWTYGLDAAQLTPEIRT